MKRSLVFQIFTAPVWLPLVLLGLVARVIVTVLEAALDWLGYWLYRASEFSESLDDRNTKPECVDSTGAVCVIENGVVRRTNPEDAR